MSSRIEVINDALVTTGNNDCAEFDGSEEWRHGEQAYRRSVGFLLNRHRWGFAKFEWPQAGTITSPSSIYQYAYARPNDCLHIEAVTVSGAALTAYEIKDDKVCCGYNSGVIIHGVRVPPMGQWPLHWIELLTLRVEQMLYEGLNEDQQAAAAKSRMVEEYLSEVRTATDQESPRRAVFKSRVAARRRGVARVV